jgi:ATP-dependent RNA helicase SUPV3L1/SUV3
VLLRLDVAERVAAELAYATRRGATALPANLASRLAVRAELLPAVLRVLGARLVPGTVLDADSFGPPAPAMLAEGAGRQAAARARRPAPPVPVRTDGPFAALAALRRHP